MIEILKPKLGEILSKVNCPSETVERTARKFRHVSQSWRQPVTNKLLRLGSHAEANNLVILDVRVDGEQIWIAAPNRATFMAALKKNAKEDQC